MSEKIQSKKVLALIAMIFLATAFGLGVAGKVLFDKESAPKEVTNYAVKSGDTFTVVMEKFGLSRETAANILEAAKDSYDFTNIKAGNLFRFTSTSNGMIGEISYDIDEKSKIVIRGTKENPIVKEEEIKYETEIMVAGNTIINSLYMDAVEVDVPPKTILNLAEIFAWDIDFVVDIREGDDFKIVYETLSRDGYHVGPGRILAANFTNQGEEFQAFYFHPASFPNAASASLGTEKSDGEGAYFNIEGRALAREFLKSPLSYSYISSGFSYNRLNPITRSSYGPHRAIDYKAPPGVPVSVTGNGRVAYAGWGRERGLYVKVDHGEVYTTLYAHLSGLARGVKTGATVKQGQVIGFVGATGLTTGPHLHYEMKKYGGYINPLILELPPGDPLPPELKTEFNKVVKELEPFLLQ